MRENKKYLSVLVLVSFLLTLFPVIALGAEPSIINSSIGVVDDEAIADGRQRLRFEVNIRDKDGYDADDLSRLRVWVERDNKVSDVERINWYISDRGVVTVDITSTLAGEVTVYAAIADSLGEAIVGMGQIGSAKGNFVAPTGEWKFQEFEISNAVLANGKDTIYIQGRLMDQWGNPVAGQRIEAHADHKGINLLKSSVTTNSRGQFAVELSSNQSGSYPIHLTTGQLEKTVYVEFLSSQGHADEQFVQVKVSEPVKANGVDRVKVSGKLIDGDTGKAITNEWIEVECNKFGAVYPLKVKTDKNGEFSFYVTALKAQTYTFELEGKDAETEVKVTFLDKQAQEQSGVAIAAKSQLINYGSSSVNQGKELAFQLTLKDKNGKQTAEIGQGNKLVIWVERGVNISDVDLLTVKEGNKSIGTKANNCYIIDETEIGSGKLAIQVQSAYKGEIEVKVALINGKNSNLETVLAAVNGSGNHIASAKGYFGNVGKKTATMYIGKKSFEMDGKVIKLDVAPFIKDYRTFVPIRALSEGFGAEVKFNEHNQEITILLDDNIVKLKLGSNIMTKNGKKIEMDTVAFATAGERTVVPFRFIAQALGFEVNIIANTDGTIKGVSFSN